MRMKREEGGRMLQPQVNCVAARQVRAQLPKPQNALHLQHGARLLLPLLLLMANVLLVLVIISAVKENVYLLL